MQAKLIKTADVVLKELVTRIERKKNGKIVVHDSGPIVWVGYEYDEFSYGRWGRVTGWRNIEDVYAQPPNMKFIRRLHDVVGDEMFDMYVAYSIWRDSHKSALQDRTGAWKSDVRYALSRAVHHGVLERIGGGWYMFPLEEE